MLRRGDYWDQDIPIEKGKLVKQCKYEHLSIDGSQYAQIIEESEEVIIQIYQVKDNQLLHRLGFPMIKNEFLTAIYGIKFSSEYLICNRDLWEPFSSQLYLFNFKINTGKLYFFEQCLQDQFYIFLYEYLIIKIYKVENDFNLILIGIQKEHEEDKTIDLVQNKNPILLILMREEKELLFFSNKLKIINKVVLNNQHSSVIFILMKDMFLKNQQNYSQMIVAQNRNGKRIIDKLIIGLQKDRFCLQTTLQISNSNSLTLCFYLSKFLLFKSL